VKKGKILVVWHDNRLMFKSPDGVLLNVLLPSDFHYATLDIIRNKKKFDLGSASEQGTHCPVPVFLGFDNVLGKFVFQLTKLFPRYFKRGDEIHFKLWKPITFEVNFAKMYAIDHVCQKLSNERKKIDSIRDSNFEEYEIKIERHWKKVESLVASFVLPSIAVLKRYKRIHF
jgi:hypothetical protein